MASPETFPCRRRAFAKAQGDHCLGQIGLLTVIYKIMLLLPQPVIGP